MSQPITKEVEELEEIITEQIPPEHYETYASDGIYLESNS
jgi:hypothetical protein